MLSVAASQDDIADVSTVENNSRTGALFGAALEEAQGPNQATVTSGRLTAISITHTTVGKGMLIIAKPGGRRRWSQNNRFRHTVFVCRVAPSAHHQKWKRSPQVERRTLILRLHRCHQGRGEATLVRNVSASHTIP
ncbi:hypothetical protein H109_01720 [Trichophyton interdigitale MR816]|uniref:Uncharacterized protein n=1 Tax=Trichophyton interdigitale (strain MR816) TaxID=1215338 RepID=A0A059JG37_TRIIM|nr:hypothetical protein H109_01720 [Trichophyton interdigitale MR816]